MVASPATSHVWASCVGPALNEDQHKDVDMFLDHFPDIELSYDARVEDEEDVREGDVLNLTVTVIRKHLPDDLGW